MTISQDELWATLASPDHLFLLAGPCVIESEALCLQVAETMQKLCAELKVPYVFKASFDKANRTSVAAYRGPGFEAGLEILSRVREALGVPVVTDVHTADQARAAGDCIDVLQIPALLCRQTDLVQAAAQTGRILNLKKGQFLSPQEMVHVAAKAVDAGGERLLLTERGASFGYNNLVSDMRSIAILRRLGHPVVFDATHSVQMPGGGGDRSSGQREFAPVLARSAVAAGAHGLFVETHPDPDRALCDGPNSLALADMPAFLSDAVAIHEVVRHCRDGAPISR